MCPVITAVVSYSFIFAGRKGTVRAVYPATGKHVFFRCVRTLNVGNFRAFRLTSGKLRHRRVVSTTDLTKLTRYNSVRPVDCVHSSGRHSALPATLWFHFIRLGRVGT